MILTKISTDVTPREWNNAFPVSFVAVGAMLSDRALMCQTISGGSGRKKVNSRKSVRWSAVPVAPK